MDKCEENAEQLLDEITREQDESSIMGQTESKKNGKNILAMHPTAKSSRIAASAVTKGSMSFGFKKGKAHAASTSEQDHKNAKMPHDNNANPVPLQVDEMSGSKPKSRLVAPRKEQSGQSYRSNRFGFRNTNSVRPISTGPDPKGSDFEDLNNNNTIETKAPRSKSAVCRNPTSVDRLNNNTAVRQNTMADIKSTRMNVPPVKTPSVDSIPMGTQCKMTTTRISIKLHSHSIDTADKDCSNDTVKKFTLHTTKLPQPEYAVPVRVKTTRMELKNVKQSLNNSRREFLGLNSQNEPARYQPSTQSGLLRHQRNLEMVMSGRHKFQVRDLEDSLPADTVVVPLTLPKLPSAFDNSAPAYIVPNGLIRQDQMEAQKDTIEEEKLLIDSKSNEKSTQFSRRTKEPQEEQTKTDNTTDSCTMKSINTSWSIAGESMVHDSQWSTKKNTCSQVTSLYSEEATLNAPPSLVADSTEKPGVEEDTDNEVTLNDVQLDLVDDEATLNEPFESELEKYANDHNDPMLEDETSPSVSLLTSNSKEADANAPEKCDLFGHNEKQEFGEDRLEDTLEPENIKSPAHTSHSNSLSEQGRDFLIDDEIADQPGLFSNFQNESPSSELLKASSNELALVKSSPLSKHRQNPAQFQIKSKLSPLFIQTSPAMKLRKVQRTDSLNTLSPCDSIASDDLMMDFDCTSSFESIDRLETTLKEEKSSVDNEMQLWKELEQQSGDLFREWKHILSTATVTNIRNTPPTPSPPPPPHALSNVPKSTSAAAAALVPSSQLPTKGSSRLLNRSRVQGCPESSRSVEPVTRPKRSSSLTKASSPTIVKGNVVCASVTTDDLSIARSTRNSMIQDVLYFKKQLLRLRRLLQEDEDILKRTETLNPFECMNGDISSPNDNKSSRLLSMYQSMDKVNANLGANCDKANPETVGSKLGDIEDANNNLSNNQEVMDMRRQLDYLQSQLDENSRTIRIQKNLITKYETEKQQLSTTSAGLEVASKAQSTVATQTERIRPVSQSRINGISSRIEPSNGHHAKSRSRSIGIPMPKRNITSNPGKQPVSLLGMGDLEDSNRQKSSRTNYTENLLLHNNNHRNRLNILSSTPPPPPPSSQQNLRGQIYSKKSSMDDLLSIKHIAVSPPKYSTDAAASPPNRVPISRISLKYLRPSLASSTNSLSSINHSIASSTSSLSDHNNSKSCLKVDSTYS